MVDCGDAVEVLWRNGVRRIALCSSAAGFRVGLPLHSAFDRTVIVPGLAPDTREQVQRAGWTVYGLPEVPRDITGVVVGDRDAFRLLMRQLEPLFRRGCIIVPASPDWVVPRQLREFGPMESAWNTTSAANYIARCNLAGHYLEFGTFWGSSFFPNYFRFRHWLRGRFFAFDSFQGLSNPDEEETRLTGGDFQAGTYCANQPSFAALRDLLGVPPDRLSIIPGFFDQTLKAVAPTAYGLEPRSVAICYIDCDLKEPTADVLSFVTPLLEPGALIYFDDWRLCRASRDFGERAAALDWLARNPNVELVEFDRENWQHQWFIFQLR